MRRKQRSWVRDDPRFSDASSVTRFILLSGNLDTGEGEVIGQPWLSVELPDLLISDIAHDWIEKLEALGLTGLSDRFDELRAGSPPQPSDLVRFGVAKRRSFHLERRLAEPQRPRHCGKECAGTQATDEAARLD